MDIDTTKRIPILLERLLKQHLPIESIPKFKRYFLQMLSTRLSKGAISENDLKNSIISRLPEKKAERFQELYLKLIKLKAIAKRTNILYILSKASEQNHLEIFLNPSQNTDNHYKLREKNIFKDFRLSKDLILMQKDVIIDILSILNQKSGKFLKFSEDFSEFTLENAVTHVPFVEISEKVLELAIMLTKLQKYIGSGHLSLTSKLLASFFESEIEEYFKFYNDLVNTPDLNMRKIDLLCESPLEKMKLLVIIADSATNLKGSQLISAIFILSRTGNPAIREFMLKVLDKVSQNLLKMIENWVNTGEIEDPFQEFFISQNTLITEDDLWAHKYSIVKELVPCFFGEDLVSKIFIIGKSINFIKTCCKEPLNLEYTVLPSIYDLENLSVSIEKISQACNNFLLQLVNFKYNLDLHFACMKKILLLSQGDFHQYLMQKIYPILNKNSNLIYKHDLAFVLENAIRLSNLKYENLDCLNRIDIKLLEPSPLDTGWDIFVLDYIVSSPLTTIFTAKSLETYARAFKLLWQIKRAQYLITLYSQGRNMIIYQSYLEVKQAMHSFQLLRHEISHFINNFVSYLIVEVVETSWKQFDVKLNQAKNLDELINVHQMFLNEITEKAFLDDEAMYRRILGLVELCVRLNDLENNLMEAAEEERKRREVFIRVGNFEELRVFEEFLCDIDVLREQFNDEFRIFREKIAGPHESHCKFLLFRLDFNEYYELKSLEY